MNILYICNEYPPLQAGGIGIFTKFIAEKLAASGENVSVFGYGDVTRPETHIENNVQVYRIPHPKYGKSKFINLFKQIWFRWRFYVELKKYSRNFLPEIIETYDWSAPLIIKPKRVKLVLRLHGSNTANNRYMNKRVSWVYYFLEKRAILIADQIVSVSDHIGKQTQKAFNTDLKYDVIHNGVDTSIFNHKHLKRDLNKILLVGRMHDYKGFKELFNSLNILFKENKYVKLEVICTIINDYRQNILNRVKSEYHSRINFLGRIDNNLLPLEYGKANLTILPSLTEAFPIIPLESMACGTPVIMSDRFSASEIVCHGQDGFLIDILDPENLAKEVLRILADQKSIEKMRDFSENKIRSHFAIEKILQKNQDFYRKVLLEP